MQIRNETLLKNDSITYITNPAKPNPLTNANKKLTLNVGRSNSEYIDAMTHLARCPSIASVCVGFDTMQRSP